ncbi:polypeptide N-acetylgalactosaminyltransferase 13-like [Gigantopelta aegis]|uniref:polypeptide N-acetylgalactosaminyltransferase 13-like n=1 Tax=Gigantopelta aegis TaxID=1735272 RepID=UPI001B88E423|nr:polypeptide N-acetylgalactosaminyltransferase 13-like [Gigantopelta aegis]XP_041361336.1 polypeptide N-acetylgalactosaminyltransferase 13-like [Gigantopelta aegis]
MRRFKFLWRSPFFKLLFFIGACALIIHVLPKSGQLSLYNSNDYVDVDFDNVKKSNENNNDEKQLNFNDEKQPNNNDEKQLINNEKQLNGNDEKQFINNEKQLNGNDEKQLNSKSENQLKGNDEKQLKVNDEHGEKKDDHDNGDKEKDRDHEEWKLREDNRDYDADKKDKHRNKFHEGNDLHFENSNMSPGYHGDAVIVDKSRLSKEELRKYDDGWRTYAFNNYVSDMISLDRPLVDVRDKQCLSQTYPKELPVTSVIICFHNEAWSALLRTVHSVINKSPRSLIHEIILVDDASTFDYLKTPLEKHVATLPVPVKIVRARKREGLIRGRLLGYQAATGKTLTFLDSHCECTDGWLEPLMARIAEGWNHVVCPIISSLEKDTFKMSEVLLKDLTVGNFNWRLDFTWGAIPDQIKDMRKSSISPLPTPTMAGGLFSIDREYFKHIGTYDHEMDIWGGENLELSFRIWMCGGSLEIIPCSIVGHVFRDRSPYSSTPGSLARNKMRVAMVWLDEYKQLYLKTLTRTPEYGDISERLALRTRLKCLSFDWYMKNIFTNAFYPSKTDKAGQLSSQADPSMCMDSLGDFSYPNKKVQWRPCVNSTNQVMCITPLPPNNNNDVI